MDQDYIIDVDSPDIIMQTMMPPGANNDTNNNIFKKDLFEKFENSENDNINGADNVTDSQNNLNDDEPWNYKILLLLKKIGKKTMGYRWMHEQESKYYDKIHNRISIIEMLMIAFLGTITGGGFINFVVNADIDDNKIVYIVITAIQLFMVFMVASIRGYRNVVKYEKKVIDHTNASNKNAELNLHIQYQLSLNIKDRDMDKVFLKNVIRSFNDILILSPNIRNSTKKKYLQESSDNDIFNPIFTEGDGLNIIINYSQDNNNSPKKNVTTNTSEVPDVNSDNIDSRINYQIDRWLQHF